MRYLLDSNVFVFLSTDVELVSSEVITALNEPDALLYMSSASVMELVIGYNNHSFDTRRWKSAEEMVESIGKDFFIDILPFREEHLLTFARLRANIAKGHKDPFDHMIISHAITERMTLVSSDLRFPFYKRQGLDLLFNKK
ncbi:MAG: type II toxin-antitoxin system VapC family toxin [Prevotella sp.]|nr:type II toxin-antitoxin system VapC family toxin [Prevotella sp.]